MNINIIVYVAVTGMNENHLEYLNHETMSVFKLAFYFFIKASVKVSSVKIRVQLPLGGSGRETVILQISVLLCLLTWLNNLYSLICIFILENNIQITP